MIAGLYGKTMLSSVMYFVMNTFFQSAWILHSHKQWMQSSYCSVPWSTLGVFDVLNFSHSDRYVVITHCCLNLQVTNNVEPLFFFNFNILIFTFLLKYGSSVKLSYFQVSIFSHIYLPSAYSFWWEVFCPILNWLFVFLLLNFEIFIYL